jgi:hypothetical protein
MLNKKHNLFLIILFISSLAYSQHRSYTDKYEYRKKRHEVTLGIGASNCLTDLGGSFISDPNSEESQIDFLRSIYDTDLAKSNFSVNAAYIYHFKRKLNFRGNLSFAQIGADDAISKDLNRENRNLNFKSSIIEVSGIVEYYFAKPITGNKYNLKDVQGHKLAPNILAHWGFYIMGGIGGFYYNPKGLNNKVYNSGAHMNSDFNHLPDNVWHKLRPLHTEGQGMEGNKTKFQKSGKTYSPVALCFPLGFGLEKAFNGDIGLKIEASYRFTNTDYLDDVSGVYHNRDEIESEYGTTAAIMSGTSSGWERSYMAFVDNEGDPAPIGADGGDLIVNLNPNDPRLNTYGPRIYTITETSTDEGFTRGDPTANDSYMFFNISMYKKFSNHTKWYRNVHKSDKRKIKASF